MPVKSLITSRSSTSTVSTVDRDAKGLLPNVNISSPGLTRKLFSEMAAGGPNVFSLYKLAILDISNLGEVKVVTNEELDPSKQRKAAEFIFHVPPKSIEVVEPYTTIIQPTMNNGKFIESQGSIMKQISISGTTGLRPRSGNINSFFQDLTSGSINRLVDSDFSSFGTDALSDIGGAFTNAAGGALAAAQNTVPQKEITGHDDIIFLRNIFRAYSDFQTHQDVGTRIMVWYNKKDGEYWIVEPKSFRVSQNSNSPLLYTYSIEFQTITPFNPDFDQSSKPGLSARDVLNSAQEITEYVIAGAGLVIQIGTEVKFIIDNPIDSILALHSPLNGLVNLLANSSTTYDNLKKLARSRADIVGVESKKLLQSLEDTYNAIKDDLDDDEEEDVGKKEDVVRNTQFVNKVQKLVEKIKTSSQFSDNVSTEAGETRARAEEVYETEDVLNPKRATALQGDDFLGQQPSASAVTQAEVQVSETIRDVARRALGNADHWASIAILNKLKAPFIAAERSEGVLQPGDPILVPAVNANGVSSANVNPVNSVLSDEGITSDNQFPISDKVNSPLELAYGRDLRSETEVTESGETFTDIGVSQTGDLATVQGLANLSQALNLKMLTEKGELPIHEFYGIPGFSGKKSLQSTITEYELSVRGALAADPRVEKVLNTNVYTFRDTLILEATIKPSASTTSITTSFVSRN